jgi:hypothetical protein
MVQKTDACAVLPSIQLFHTHPKHSHTSKACRMLLVGFACADPQESAKRQQQSSAEQDKGVPQHGVTQENQQTAQVQQPQHETREPQQGKERAQSRAPQNVKDGSVGGGEGGEGKGKGTVAGSEAQVHGREHAGTQHVDVQERDRDVGGGDDDDQDSEAQQHLRLLLQQAGFGEHGREWGDDTQRKAAKAEDVYKVIEKAGSASVQMHEIMKGAKAGKAADDESEWWTIAVVLWCCGDACVFAIV